ncbi:MAG: zinc ribbon domain-containing protein [Dehalococcoidia bacterium]|nr:zinc ribbon domain-containing protein [Dehalococcoidia bacterium]
MPTYEYQCSACGHRFDKRQSFDAPTVIECPKCQKEAQRQLSAVPIIFKGSGWYTTDYAKKSGTYPSPTPAETGTSSTASSGSERQERTEQAREERGKPPAPAPSSPSSTPSGGKPAASPSTSSS